MEGLALRWGIEDRRWKVRSKRPCLRWIKIDETGHVSDLEAEVITYGQLLTLTQRAAGWLTSLGLTRGDVLGIQAPRSPLWLPLFLGALSQGVTVLLLNESYTPADLNFFIKDAGVRVALLPDVNHEALVELNMDPGAPSESHHAQLISTREIEVGVNKSLPLEMLTLRGDELAVLAYTSGTTGVPKGARIRHADLYGTIQALDEAWGWSEADVLLHTLPLFHIHGLFVAALGALWASAELLLLSRFEARQALEIASRAQATIIMGVPTHHHRYLQIPEDARPPMPTLRLVTSGSAPLSAEQHRAFSEAFGVEIVERYGMTEVGIVLSNPIDGKRIPGSVGLPLPGVEVKVCDEVDHLCPVGDVGQIHITSASLFEGYHNRPEATAQALYLDDEGRRWMRTGDLGYQSQDGYITLTGRASDLIISGGLNVYPAEIERAILQVGAGVISEAAVLGAPDAEWGERVTAYLVPQGLPHQAHEQLGAIREALNAMLASYKRPKRYQWIEALPRNAMGKVQRHRLRPQWRSGGCHCRAVRWRASLPQNFEVERCDCSICAMSGNVHVILPQVDFDLETGGDQLTKYQFNTQRAEHLFCRRCGVKSFYIPRSNPEGIAITWRCLDTWRELEVTVRDFDGQRWETEADRLAYKSQI